LSTDKACKFLSLYSTRLHASPNREAPSLRWHTRWRHPTHSLTVKPPPWYVWLVASLINSHRHRHMPCIATSHHIQESHMRPPHTSYR
jgi:hypothetical protein